MHPLGGGGRCVLHCGRRWRRRRRRRHVHPPRGRGRRGCRRAERADLDPFRGAAQVDNLGHAARSGRDEVAEPSLQKGAVRREAVVAAKDRHVHNAVVGVPAEKVVGALEEIDEIGHRRLLSLPSSCHFVCNCT